MLERLLRNGRELILAAAMIVILIVLFSPIPSMLLDLAILINFGLGLTILLLTFYVQKPVEFSTFPSLLLISTLFRLSLNVAATRLILTSAGAGAVINAIGTFAVSGNFVVGLVVFFILVVVQYVVVTSGAQRVSEVAARFTLDSMPGQQMSIDADLNMGLIDQKQAVARRAALEKEGAFYGAMDGASKFVKGDAIAGVIILIIDIIAGWIIGVMQMGMDWSEALQRFTLLTIGDGIATQLPALIISIATGIIVTRSSADRELSIEVIKQLGAAPRVPIMVAAMLGLILLLPGMPKWPLILVGGFAIWSWRRAAAAAAPVRAEESIEAPADAETNNVLNVALGARLAQAWRPRQALLMDRVARLRESHERMLGLPFPALQFVDAAELGPAQYEIRLFGARYASGEIEADRQLALRSESTRMPLEGIAATDPAFGLPGYWIENQLDATARNAGYTLIDADTVFITHLGETLRSEAAGLLTRAHVVALLDGVRTRQPGLVEEMTPALLSVSDIQRVLQNLLSESVSIAAIDLICEHLVDVARQEKDPGALTELVRQKIGYHICDRLKGRHSDLAVLSLEPRLESQLQAGLASAHKKDQLLVEPRLAEQIMRKLARATQDMTRAGREAVLLCGNDLRRPLRALLRRSAPRLAILSVAEIPTNIELKSFAVVKLDADPRAAGQERQPLPPNPASEPGYAATYQ
ncbi:MAG: flagellar biosynthesis protein FlhA [Terricaulis sp.]